jgi:DNA-binding LacI/PurR family transcriptional regulator
MQAARHMLMLAEPPTAFFCFNDQSAMGVIRGLNRAGAHVPGDYSVVGFDDLEMAAYYCPPLTTVRQPSYRLGQRAISILLELMNGHQNLQAESLPAELIVRETTAPAPGRTS